MSIIQIEDHYIEDSLLNEDSIIFDCGACVGNFTQPLWDKYHCNFYLYEPDPRNFRQLKYRFFDKKIRLNKKLISNSEGNGFLYTGRFPTASSIFNTHRGLDGNSLIVEQTSIKKEIGSFDYIDLLKLDIEGEEISVITHMDKVTLSKINQISVEFHLQSEIKDYTEEDVWYCRDRLIRNGFKEIIYEPNEGTNKGQEALYIQ